MTACSLNSIKMISRSCPICGSNDETKVFAEADFDPAKWDAFAFASRKLPEYMHYRLVNCSACDLNYANPTPSLDTIADAYEEASFDSGMEAEYASRTYASLLPHIKKQLSDFEGAIDIGTGDGAFLEKLQLAGFTNIIGVEPSSAPIFAAKENVRTLIRQGLFRAGDFPQSGFQLITCFQTIEHLYDPLLICQDIHALLKNGGAIYLICHNRNSLVNRLLGFKSPIFDIEHLQLFSPHSVEKLLQNSGFNRIEIKPIMNRYPLHYWFKLFPLPGTVKLKIHKVLQRSWLGNVLIPIPVGNMAAIGYKDA